MPKQDRYTAEQMIAAIKGTGGIKLRIAKNAECTTKTVRRYLAKYPTVRKAYEDERDKVIDLAESVLIQQLRMLAEQQAKGKIVDLADVRWFLAHQARDRGYGEQVQHDGEVKIVIEYGDDA